MRPHRTLAPRSKSARLGRPPTPLPPGRCSGRNRSFRVFSPAQGPPSQSQICPSICPSRCLKCGEDARCKHRIAQPPCSCPCPPGHSHCASPHARGPFRNTLFARLEAQLLRHAPRNFRHAGMPRLRCPSPPPKPAPASAYLNKPKPLPAQPPATPNPASSSTPDIEAPSKRQEPIAHQQRLGPPRLQTMLAKEDARKLECNRIWLLLLDKLRDTSSLWTETTQSLTPERLRVRAISAYAASSLEAYLSRCTRFLDFLQAHNIAFSTLSLVELADYLEAAFASLAQDRDVCQISPKTTLKALSWLSRMAQVQHLLELLSNPLISTYRIDIKPRDRREALPIPMACIVSWERLVCKSSTGTQMVLLLGAFLLAYHACLRFGDLQRIRLSSLSLTTQALRGICWTTKTSRSGQPFAVTLTGISGRGPSTSWCLAYLTRLHASCRNGTLLGLFIHHPAKLGQPISNRGCIPIAHVLHPGFASTALCAAAPRRSLDRRPRRPGSTQLHPTRPQSGAS